MSRKANCWDNAVAESFFKGLKSEMIYGDKLVSKQEIKTQLFEYLEIWYNRKRRHSFLNYLTIKEFNELQQEKKIETNLVKIPYLCVQVLLPYPHWPITVTQDSNVPCLRWLKDILGDRSILHDNEYVETLDK